MAPFLTAKVREREYIQNGAKQSGTLNKDSVFSKVEPQNKGHFVANSFVPCRGVVPISEVK